METTLLKVGSLAKKTGLTVRTLHYYEEIGLLKPATRSDKGYRLYGIREIQRLQQILSLQQLGFPLDQIKNVLDNPDYSLQSVLTLHINHLQDQIITQQHLLSRLQTISHQLEGEEEISLETLLQTIRSTKMFEAYYSPKQLETLRQRKHELGPKGMEHSQLAWTKLIQAFQEELSKGTNPEADPVQDLVASMQELIHAFTGGDPALEQSLKTMYRTEGPEKASSGTVNKAVFEFINKAQKYANLKKI